MVAPLSPCERSNWCALRTSFKNAIFSRQRLATPTGVLWAKRPIAMGEAVRHNGANGKRPLNKGDNMGYTHYYRHGGGETLGKTLLDAKAILKYAKANGPVIAGPDGTGAPVLEEGLLLLNGHGDDDCETFLLDSREGRTLCKTGSRPYDSVVTAILIRLGLHGGEVSSDGNWDDWANGRAICEAIWGEALNPMREEG